MISVDDIKREALRLGFSACGVANAEFFAEDSLRLQRWLNAGMNGEMSYMANHFDMRTDPTKLFVGAKSAVVVLADYFREKQQNSHDLQIAKYAYGADYHYVIKDKLRQLQAFIESESDCCSQVCCDSAPVLERRLAERAGLGWIGKSGLLVNAALGSYTLIGTLITSLDLPPDTPQPNRCGTCTRCLDACPTCAIVEPYVLDARRCISYLTIEHRGEIPTEFLGKMGKRIFGCDACLDACPWNARRARSTSDILPANEQIFEVDWANLTCGSFKRLFKNSPLQRAGFRKIRQLIEQGF